MTEREQLEAIRLLERWLKLAKGKPDTALAASLERVRLEEQTKEFLATSNLEDVE